MKFEKRSWLGFSFALIYVLAAATTGYTMESSQKTSFSEVKRETWELIQALKSYTADQRDTAIQKSKSALNDLDNRIDDLETRIDNNWDTMDKATRQKARESLRALRKQRIRVAEWYGSLKSSTVSAWDHMKKGFSDAVEELSDAWQKSENEFGSGK
jgi:hypothetical protein